MRGVCLVFAIAWFLCGTAQIYAQVPVWDWRTATPTPIPCTGGDGVQFNTYMEFVNWRSDGANSDALTMMDPICLTFELPGFELQTMSHWYTGSALSRLCTDNSGTSQCGTDLYLVLRNMVLCHENVCVNPCWLADVSIQQCIHGCLTHSECAAYTYSHPQYPGATTCSAQDVYTPGPMHPSGYGFCTTPCLSYQCDPEYYCYPVPFLQDGNAEMRVCEVNECATDNGGCNPVSSTCLNSIGDSRDTAVSYTCECNPGYTPHPSASNVCVDIDECNLNTHDCNTNVSTCFNVPGSYWCMCANGYTSDEAKRVCTDINECTENEVYPCLQGFQCENTPGNYTCVDVDECTSSPPVCAHSNACNNTHGGYECICKNGYNGTLCQNKYPDPTSNSIRSDIAAYWNATQSCVQDMYYNGDANATEWAIMSSRNQTRAQVMDCCTNVTSSATLCKVFLYLYVNVTFVGNPFHGTPLRSFMNHATAITTGMYTAYNTQYRLQQTLVYDPKMEHSNEVDWLVPHLYNFVYERFRFTNASCCARVASTAFLSANPLNTLPGMLFASANSTSRTLVSGTWREEEDMPLINVTSYESFTLGSLTDWTNAYTYFVNNYPGLSVPLNANLALNLNQWRSSAASGIFRLSLLVQNTAMCMHARAWRIIDNFTNSNNFRLPYICTCLSSMYIPFFDENYLHSSSDYTGGSAPNAIRNAVYDLCSRTVNNYITRPTNTYVVQNKPKQASSLLVYFTFNATAHLLSVDYFRYTFVRDFTQLLANATNEPVERFAFIEYTFSDYNQQVPLSPDDFFRVLYEVRSRDAYDVYYNTTLAQLNATLYTQVQTSNSFFNTFRFTSNSRYWPHYSVRSEFTTQYLPAEPYDFCDTFPCMNGGSCSNGESSYTCSCSFLFAGNRCQWLNACLENNCTNTNNNTLSCVVTSDANYTCLCNDGFIGTFCELDADDCASSPCQNAGVCVDSAGQYSCNCTDGYSGLTCATEIDECASSPCLNAGLCVDGMANFTCNCTSCYDGALCAYEKNECASAPCQNEGVCVDSVCGYTCECTDGYEGIVCEQQLILNGSSSSSSSSSTGTGFGEDNASSGANATTREGMFIIVTLIAITVWTLVYNMS